MEVLHEPQPKSLLVEVALKVEQESLDLQLGAAKRGPVADGQGRNEVALRSDDPTRIGAERRHELVRFRADVRGRKAELPADLRPGLDRPAHLELAAEKTVRRSDIAGRDQAADLRAVELVAVELEWRHDLDPMAVRA